MANRRMMNQHMANWLWQIGIWRNDVVSIILKSQLTTVLGMYQSFKSGVGLSFRDKLNTSIKEFKAHHSHEMIIMPTGKKGADKTILKFFKVDYSKKKMVREETWRRNLEGYHVILPLDILSYYRLSYFPVCPKVMTARHMIFRHKDKLATTFHHILN